MSDDEVSTSSTGDTSAVELVETPVLLRVVKGEPTADELAALVAVVAARRSAGLESTDDTGPRRSGWTNRARAQRGIHRHGPDGWRQASPPLADLLLTALVALSSICGT